MSCLVLFVVCDVFLDGVWFGFEFVVGVGVEWCGEWFISISFLRGFDVFVG